MKAVVRRVEESNISVWDEPNDARTPSFKFREGAVLLSIRGSKEFRWTVVLDENGAAFWARWPNLCWQSDVIEP